MIAKHTYLLLILSLNCFGQDISKQIKYGLENYEWNKLMSVTIQVDDSTEYDSDKKMLYALETSVSRINCGNIGKWKSAFATLPYGPNQDITVEKTYILLCEFENGLKIPFLYFPKQYAIFDMRNEYRYFYSFPKRNNRMRSAVNNCIRKLEKRD